MGNANGNRRRQEQPAPAAVPATAPTAPRPVNEVRLGRVKAAIWANETENGIRYGVTVCRVYKDQQQKWQTSESFGRDELLLLAKVLDLAHTWICENAKGQEVGI